MSPNIPAIQIPEYSLKLKKSYTYQLFLHGEDFYTRAFITANVNSTPSGGTISVEPTSGEAFLTYFRFDAYRYKDIEGNYPLTYGFIVQLD